MTHTDVKYLETNIFWLILLAIGILFFCEWGFYKLASSLNQSENIPNKNKIKNSKTIFLGAFLVAIILFLITSLLFPYKEINTYKTIQIDQTIENFKYYEYDKNKIYFKNGNRIETLKLNNDTKVYLKNKSKENKIEIYRKKYIPILGNYEDKIVKVNIYTIKK